jgi:hypothetical protein
MMLTEEKFMKLIEKHGKEVFNGFHKVRLVKA